MKMIKSLKLKNSSLSKFEMTSIKGGGGNGKGKDILGTGSPTDPDATTSTDPPVSIGGTSASFTIQI